MDNTFFGSGLERVVIPEGVESIAYAFYYCTSLEEVILPDSLKYIGTNTFRNCFNLKNLHLGNGIETINECGFGNCISLESIVLPYSLLHLSNSAFGGCSALKSVTLPASLVELSDGAFEGCTNLTDMYYTGTREQWEALNCSTICPYGIQCRFMCADDEYFSPYMEFNKINKAIRSVSVNVHSYDAIYGNAYAAAYGEDGNLLDVATGTCLLNTYTTTSFSCRFSSREIMDNAAYYKIMVFDAWEPPCKPICTSLTVSAN